MKQTKRLRMVLIFSVIASVAHANAQTAADDMQLMRQNVELLSATLEDGLGLNERRGVFSPRAGDIRGRYLQGLGVMFEIHSNWQRRDAPAMDAFSDSLGQLSSQLDGLLLQGVVQRPDFEAMRDQLALSMRSDEVAVFYREMMQQISAMQEIPAIERGLAAAASSFQTLQSMGHLDESTQLATSGEIQSIRAELDQQLQILSDLREQIRAQALTSETLPDQSTQARWLSLRESMSRELLAIQARVSEQAGQLQLRREQAEQLGREQAQQALDIFQRRMFELLCDYSAGLRGLPEQESIIIVLAGAGEVMANSNRRDIVYHLAKDALSACQQGRQTPEQLQTAATRYQY
jgi:hypothetical protein